MGDPRGFLKVRTRRELAERPVEERIKDWFDVHTESGLQSWTTEQAARCMDCGTPFCMNGCPLGNIIPEFNDLVRQEKWEDAYNRLSETNNFPEVTGRICPALCEAACVLGIHQPATMIQNDERTIIDQAWSLDYVKPLPPQRLTDQTVAVVGSGPSGLACAQQLTRAGHTVVVYERDDAIGGLMRYGIPNFKLDKRLLDRRVEQMEAEGTVFRTGVEIGKDISCRMPPVAYTVSSPSTTSPPKASMSSSSAAAIRVPIASALLFVRVRRTSPCCRSCRRSRSSAPTTSRGRRSRVCIRKPPLWRKVLRRVAPNTCTTPTR